MQPERWQHIDRLFHEALKRDREERSRFLAEACGGDKVLRDELEALIESHEAADSFIENPAS